MATYTKTYSLTINTGSPTGNTVYEAINYTDLNIDGLVTNLNACHMTTRGDMIYRGAAAASRLAIGANGTYLRSDGTDPFWGWPFHVTTGLVASVYTVGSSQDVLEFSTAATAITVTLPHASTVTGKRVVIVRTNSSADANDLTVTCGSGTINGSATVSVPACAGGTLAVYSNGTNWKKFAPSANNPV